MRSSAELARLPRAAALILAAVLTLAAGAVGYAQTVDRAESTDSAESVDPGLSADRPVFRVGITELGAARVPVERRYVASTFPLLLYESLRGIDSRVLSDDEILAYGTTRLDAARREAAAALRDAVDRRDRLFFERTTTDAAVAAARDALVAARTRYDLLERMDPRVPVERSRPFEFLASLESGTLLPAPAAGIDALLADQAPLRAAAERDDLDALLFGYAEEIAGYIVVDTYLYHRFPGTVVPLAVTTRLAEEIGEEAPIMAVEIAEALLGRPWSTIIVTVDQPSAAIRLDSALVGLGSARLPYVEPGEYALRVSAAGWAPVDAVLSVAPGETRELAVSLTASTARPVRVQSSPSGANVYVDSVWVGRTPIVHRFPSGSTTVRLALDNYLESRFVVDETTPATLSRALLADTVDWGAEIRHRQEGFYRSLTWFVVSIPVTMVLWGGYQSILGVSTSPDIDTLSFDEERRMVRNGNILYWSAIGGFMINAGLLVNVVFSIVDYVAVGEGSHNQ